MCSVLMFIWTKHKCCHIINQKFTKFIDVHHTFTALSQVQYRLVGCDKLVLLYCICIWFGFTLVLAGIHSKLLNHSSKLMQPQISLLKYAGQTSIFLPVTTQCNYITLARVRSAVREGGILFVNQKPFCLNLENPFNSNTHSQPVNQHSYQTLLFKVKHFWGLDGSYLSRKIQLAIYRRLHTHFCWTQLRH